MRLSKEEAGALVFDALMDNPQGVAKWQICQQQRMTASQVASGLAWVRDVLADQQIEPIVYLDGAYKLAQVARESTRYMKARFLVTLRQAQRIRTGTLEPSIAKFGGNAVFDRALIDVRRLEEDLEQLVSNVR
jgi:hypothetical protein